MNSSLPVPDECRPAGWFFWPSNKSMGQPVFYPRTTGSSSCCPPLGRLPINGRLISDAQPFEGFACLIDEELGAMRNWKFAVPTHHSAGRRLSVRRNGLQGKRLVHERVAIR